MSTRRDFLGNGFKALALGLMASRGGPPLRGFPGAGLPAAGRFGSGFGGSRPLTPVGPDTSAALIDGWPFSGSWGGDFYPNLSIPFHSCENCFGDTGPPAPSEEVEVAIIGGGISGLTTAYQLRDRRPALFEMRPRFGGNAQGEVWQDTAYSLGCAYVITPDEGTFLDQLYRELGLDKIVRVHSDDNWIELEGQILTDFFSGLSAGDKAAFARYAEVVEGMAYDTYPDIPLPPGDNQWILDLDRKSLKQDLEEQMGMPIPPLLAAAVQAYCYSSFAAGWQEISAASGWNFLAAEEFGRWVFPGGVAAMADALWQALGQAQGPGGGGAQPILRSDCTVVDLRLTDEDRVQVTWAEADGKMRSLLAQKVVVCCSKRVAKYLIHDLKQHDADKLHAMDSITHNGYVVVNVLLHEPIELDFYDIFLLGDGNFPMTGDAFAEDSRVVDMLSGHYAQSGQSPSGGSSSSVLTLYWPLPFALSRFTLITDDSWTNYAHALVPQLERMLQLLGLSKSAVRQVRMTRWGHAVPIAAPGLIADGVAARLQRPLGDRMFFVNQDNWALPAIENCLLDAQRVADEVRSGL